MDSPSLLSSNRKQLASLSASVHFRLIISLRWQSVSASWWMMSTLVVYFSCLAALRSIRPSICKSASKNDPLNAWQIKAYRANQLRDPAPIDTSSTHRTIERCSGTESLLRHPFVNASTTNCWSSSICLVAARRVRLKRLLSLCGPQRSCPFALIALELVGAPEQRAEDDGAIIAGQVNDPGFDDEPTEFDEVPRALAALDLPCPHVMPVPCCLIPVECCPVAPECR